MPGMADNHQASPMYSLPLATIAPSRCRRRDADGQVAQRGFSQDDAADAKGGADDHDVDGAVGEECRFA